MQKLYLILLFPFTIIGQTQMGSNIFPELQNEQAGWFVSMSSDGQTVAVGAQPKDEEDINFARARVYDYDGQDWIQKGQSLEINNFNSNYSTRCRVSLSNDGNILAISTPFYGSAGNGLTQIFQYNGTIWEQMGQDIIGEEKDYSGYSISISADGNIVAILSSGYTSFPYENYGSVKAWQYNGSTWERVGQSIDGYFNSDAYYAMDQAVVDISADGTVIAIGTPFTQVNDSNGQVRVFKYSNGLWQQMGDNLIGDGGLNSGWSVSISADGNTIASGNLNSGMGYVQVFDFDTDWIQKGTTIYGNVADDYFGASVSISEDGNIVAVGAPFSNVVSSYHKGLARIFKFSDNDWSQVGSDINGAASNDLFGYDLALSSSGDILAIASPYQNNYPYYDSGNVNVYNLSDILSTDKIENNTFSIYPNPAQEFLNIVLENKFTIKEVNIYNSIGQLIKKEKTNLINVSDLAVGSYYIHVISNQFTETAMFIKN